MPMVQLYLFKNLQNNILCIIYKQETCRKNIKTRMVMINTKLITVVNSQEGAKRNGLGQGHWPHLFLHLFVFLKKI